MFSRQDKRQSEQAVASRVFSGRRGGGLDGWVPRPTGDRGHFAFALPDTVCAKQAAAGLTRTLRAKGGVPGRVRTTQDKPNYFLFGEPCAFRHGKRAGMPMVVLQGGSKWQ